MARTIVTVNVRELRLLAWGSWYKITRINGVLSNPSCLLGSLQIRKNGGLGKRFIIYPQTVALQASFESFELRSRLYGPRKPVQAKFWQGKARSVFLEKRTFLLHALLA
jgi:hypothetical protein